MAYYHWPHIDPDSYIRSVDVLFCTGKLNMI